MNVNHESYHNGSYHAARDAALTGLAMVRQVARAIEQQLQSARPVPYSYASGYLDEAIMLASLDDATRARFARELVRG